MAQDLLGRGVRRALSQRTFPRRMPRRSRSTVASGTPRPAAGSAQPLGGRRVVQEIHAATREPQVVGGTQPGGGSAPHGDTPARRRPVAGEPACLASGGADPTLERGNGNGGARKGRAVAATLAGRVGGAAVAAELGEGVALAEQPGGAEIVARLDAAEHAGEVEAGGAARDAGAGASHHWHCAAALGAFSAVSGSPAW